MGKTALQRFSESRFAFMETGQLLTPVRSVAIKLIFADLPAKRVAVNSEHSCRTALISMRAFQSALDKTLFKFPDCFLEQNPSFHHLTDEPFQLIFHDATLRLRIKSCLRARLASPVRGQPGCETPPGIWHESPRLRRGAVRVRVASWATGSVRGSREQIVCQRKAERRQAGIG